MDEHTILRFERTKNGNFAVIKTACWPNAYFVGRVGPTNNPTSNATYQWKRTLREAVQEFNVLVAHASADLGEEV